MVFIPPREVPLRARLKEIDELVRCEETERALARLNRIESKLLTEEEHLRVLLLRCWVFLQAQQMDKLDECLAETFQLAPENFEVRLIRAHFYAHVGREREAVREAAYVSRMSESEEHSARAYMIVGLALYRTRHFDWAINYSERSEAFYRWSGNDLLASWVSVNLGLCYKALAQFDVALAFIRKAFRTLPTHGYQKIKFRAILNEGVVLLLLGEIPLARAAFASAMNSDHSTSQLHACLTMNNMAHTFRMQGNTAMALEYYGQALQTAVAHRLSRQECISLYWSAETHMDAGDLLNAERFLRRAKRIADRLKHKGLLQEVLRRSAELYAKQGNLDSANSCLSRAQRLTKTLKQPRDQALLKRTSLLISTAVVSEAQVLDLFQEFRRLGDRYEFSKTVLLFLERLKPDPRRCDWLTSTELEARFYMAAMGLDSWQNRLNVALRGSVLRPETQLDFQRNRENFERSEIEAALSEAAGVTRKAALLLGLGRNTLAQKIKSHRIDRSSHLRRSRSTDN